MRRLFLVLTVLALSAPVFAGNNAPSGSHYNLNIIGVEKGKNPTMTGSNRHSIFVALGKSGSVTTRIYLAQGPFKVCDGNGFDPAYDCDGNQFSTSGAAFQLPCNTNISSTGGEDLIPCTSGESAAYEVWARALGKPNGSATITTCADPDTGTQGDEVCSTENVVLVRTKGKQTFTNVTQELTSLLAQLDADIQLERVALFQGSFEEWFWEYDNNGLRLAQLRFYLLD